MALQKFPDSRQLLAELKNQKISGIYLFLGEEDGEKEKIIQKITDMAITNEEEKNYSTGRFHAEYDELNQAVEFVSSGSMFSETKVCVILNINSIKSKGNEAGLFDNLLETLPDSNILIMTSPENKVPAVIDKKYIQKIKIYQFWRFFEKDISNYIIKSLKKYNIEIHIKAVELFIDFTGRDVKKVDEALFKIINSGEKNITIDLVRQLIPDDKDVSVFAFIDSLFQKDFNSFRNLVKVLDHGNHELAVLKLIMREAELIEKYLTLLKNRVSSDSALMEIGISQRNRKQFLDCAGCFTIEDIKKIFFLIYLTDYRLKSYNYSSNLQANPLFIFVSELLTQKNIK
ncbi:MAG: DNA polymerase III subunit delta [Spirochaetes bacterium]|nr:DNA polymerase III subunit delta [Spirochaetota bacterium]